MPRITIYISDDVGKGLADYPRINKSKVCQDALRRAIKEAGWQSHLLRAGDHRHEDLCLDCSACSTLPPGDGNDD